MFIQWFNCIDFRNYLQCTGSAAPGSTGVAFNQLWHHRTYCIQRNRFYWPRIQRLDALMR